MRGAMLGDRALMPLFPPPPTPLAHPFLHQVAVAALDSGDSKLAEELVGKLGGQFPGSVRVERLRGMILEAQGEWGRADTLYKKILEEDETNQAAMKRRVAVARGRGDLAGAAKQLKEYLGTFQADAEAWEELLEVYLQLGMHRQAAFCAEELILANPQNPGHHLRLAELFYTLGGAENLRTALAYFAGALELTDGRSARALYGATAVAAQLQGGKPGERLEGEEARLCQQSARMLVKLYRAQCPAKLPLLLDLLKQQGLEGEAPAAK